MADDYESEFEDGPSRQSDQAEEKSAVEDLASEIQRGFFKRPQFYGDQADTDSNSSFSAGSLIAAGYSAVTKFAELVDQRDDETDSFALTYDEYDELVKVAASIASYGNIPQATVEEFLIILCYIDNYTDLKAIADGVQIAELDNANLLQKPYEILAVPTLYMIAFMASAVDGLINMFSKYLDAAQSSENGADDGDDISGVIDALSSLFGALGSGATARLELSGAENAIGNFMSELITGKRIPMTVIAKNPALQIPSFVGKAFFGESPTALANIDIDQVFAKKIAAFPRLSSGAGTTSFGLQNLSMFSNSMSVTDLISTMLFGSVLSDDAAASIVTVVEDAVSKVNTLTGSTSDEVVDVRAADTAIPLLQAFSAVTSGTDKSVFSIDTFSKGWVLANSVRNHLQIVNPSFMEATRRFL